MILSDCPNNRQEEKRKDMIQYIYDIFFLGYLDENRN